VVVVSHGDVVAGILGEAEGTPVADRWGKNQIPAGTMREVVVTEGGMRAAR
jgi:broad specificity phosphatase PhoE